MQLFSDKKANFDQLCKDFEWQIPEYFNMADAVCDKHIDIADQVALYYENEFGEKHDYSFGDIRRLTNQLAHALHRLGIRKGDRVAIILSQRIETAITHVAAHKLGAISLPLSVLFGPDALAYRLEDSGAKILVTTAAIADKTRSIEKPCDSLKSVLVCDQPQAPDLDFWELLSNEPDEFENEKTHADDPALLIYTSGTTGPPKGALIAHRCLIGNLTGFELSQNFFPEKNDVFWTPADWAWTGGLLDGLLPTWYYGKPVLGYEGRKFDPKKALSLMQDYHITTGFFPPTALKMLRSVDNIRENYQLSVRSMMSAGEAVGEELITWGREVFGIDINEMCGQTEHNYMIGNCSKIMPLKPGSMGKAYPGHRVEVMDEKGNILNTGETGEFVALRNDAVHFLGYWKNQDATHNKYTGEWFHTGDVGYRDEDGYLWFMGRTDDVISSAGYRIGPGEIEDCLLRHPAVLQAAAVGVPDPEGLRGDVVKAYLVLKPGHTPSESLKQEIQADVRKNLAAYEFPRAIEFINALPMTTTGKVRRIELRKMSESQ